MPAELDEITRKVMRLEIEETALKKEKDKASKERLDALKKELADLQAAADAMKAQWENEKSSIEKVRNLRESLELARMEEEKSVRENNLERVAKLRHGTIPDIESQLKEAEKEIGTRETGTLLREEVTEEEIAEVISRWAGIPLTKLLEGERAKLLKLDEVLHERVIGQDEAVQAVADAVLRARAGIKSPNRPIGSFLFLGPTGVGKTELARTLAWELFDSEANMVRIDMSEYMEKHTVSRLVGAPPGYIGFEEGGQLTEAVRRKPYCVVLLDEIEKAHHDVFNILLQILEDGRLTDSHGRTVSFKNTIVIMTSNMGSTHLLDGIDSEGHISEEARTEVMQALRANFRPEFLNRIDETVLFKPLTLEEITSIVELLVNDLRGRLAQLGILLEIDKIAEEFIAKEGFDPVYGARPLKRFIQQDLETPLSRMIIAGDVSEGTKVNVSVQEGRLSLTTG